jgi:1-acyl-sn-glycerol-3-phosphate acyltransferase
MSESPVSAELTRFEQLALRVARATNEVPGLKRLQGVFLRGISYSWIRQTVLRRTLVEGLDEVAALRPDRGVIMASNHRSFFDQYILLLSMYGGGASWAKRLYFPVRANFFYEHPAGALLNMLIGGNVMYPPVFRQAERAALTKDSVERMVRFLGEPGTVVGIHPEGTRGKGPDPYEMLPAQPGIGQLALQSQAIVLPAWVNGLSNDIVGDVRDNFRAGIRRVRPLIVVLGDPVDYSEFAGQKPRPTLYKKTADLIRKRIAELGERERELRRQCLAGEISDDDPRWLANRGTPAMLPRIDD